MHDRLVNVSLPKFVATRKYAFAWVLTVIWLILAIYQSIESVRDLRSSASPSGAWIHVPVGLVMWSLFVLYAMTAVWLLRHPDGRDPSRRNR